MPVGIGIAGAGVIPTQYLTSLARYPEVSTAAIRAGKHVWSERPLGLDRPSARGLLDEAAPRGLQVCCAPDTVLGPGVQATLRAIVDGRPATVRADHHAGLRDRTPGIRTRNSSTPPAAGRCSTSDRTT